MSGAAWTFSWKDITFALEAFSAHCYCTECYIDKPFSITISPLLPEITPSASRSFTQIPPSSTTTSLVAASAPSPRLSPYNTKENATRPFGCLSCTLETVPDVLYALQDLATTRRGLKNSSILIILISGSDISLILYLLRMPNT